MRGRGEGDEREEEGERREDISASTVCFLLVEVAWRLL